MKQTIYFLGNNHFKNDKIADNIISQLKKKFPALAFQHLDPTDEFPIEKHLVLLDTIINTNKVVVLKDIEKIVASPMVSVHDMDLGMSLKLAQKMGNIKDVTIIGLPPKKNKQVIDELISIIKHLT